MASPSPMTSPSTPSPSLADVHFDNTLGALLVGGLVAIALWGVACTQTYIYFENTYRHARDRAWLRSLIAVLWVLDTFDSCLHAHILYHYLVSNFLDPLAMAVPVWSVIIHVFMTSLQDFIIRLLFARRVLRLSNRNWLLTSGIFAVSLLDLVCGIAITGRAFKVASFAELNTMSWLFYLNFAAGTTADAYVASSLCYYLHKSRTGFPRTESLINVLMMYTINTGLLTAIDASLGMITYIVMPNNFIFLAFYLLLSKLYLNSYLASLNSRRLRADGGGTTSGPEIMSIHLSRLPAPHEHSSPSTAVEKTSTDRASPLEIAIATEIKRQSEDFAAIASRYAVNRSPSRSPGLP
ncbi:hypothetical protein PLICRDRAFT_435591 [Plicaturopsis crispa FD-325 SS-3]|uniref:DUF6534 domain-containing protein n=1 Tax=Plicaturopsis crispa FD-325 SS-3 TaxID=944288 RepID=A0A0C9SQR5_PLICR|nr:hypothetical protein PLICRDRAFT_435591 [Plicaturopsis crispa FD-325 SS-3]